MKRTIPASIRKWGKVGLILALLAGVVFLGSLFSAPFPAASAADLALLPLEGHQRILIFAPHCDDETLSSAGIILAARRAGIEVRVVIATNGDGYFFATAQDFHKIYPHAQDYIRMGGLRQQESLSALALLGVPSSQVYFLSYPDRGSPSMWNDNWSAGNPYRSQFTGDTQSPYPLTYDPQDVYAGEDYLGDIASILKSYRPDLIIYPNPEDVHPDHWGLNAFTRLASTQAEHDDPSYRPDQYTYLVHRPDFPVVRGLKPQEGLAPPPAVYAISPHWLRWDLTPADVTLKAEAVQAYKSQLPLLRGLMESFVRRNELFAPVSSADLVTAAAGDPRDPSTWSDASGQVIPPVQLDPAHDTFTRDAVPGADLTAVHAARSGDMLWACGEVRDYVESGLVYLVRLKALTAGGLVQYQARTGETQAGWQAASASRKYFCIQVPLADLGNPWAVYLGVESQGLERTVIDRSAWQMIYVETSRRP
jgi:N-acetyl-1-D-myo-inositol-2-amino-2-deoxy-alpha-D-glucopyranoside deacetylase